MSVEQMRQPETHGTQRFVGFRDVPMGQDSHTEVAVRRKGREHDVHIVAELVHVVQLGSQG